MRASGKITTRFALGLGALIATGCAGGAGAGAGAPASAEAPHGPGTGPASGHEAAPDQELVALSLVADTAAVVPGRPLILAARFDMDPGWHIYWENPGESGLATEASFTAPAGFAIGAVRFPGPVRFTSPGPVESYGYAGSVLLSAPVHAPATLAEGAAVSFAVDAFWLACRDVCVRGGGKAELTLPVAAPGSAPAPAHQPEMDAHAARLPRPWPREAQHAWEAGPEGPVLVLVPPAGAAGGEPTFFPSAEDQLVVAGQEPARTERGDAVRVRYRAAPEQVRGVLGAGDVFYRIELPGPAAGVAGNGQAAGTLP